MPRSPNTPCRTCGKLCWPSYKRKGESHFCRECRRAEAGGSGGRHGFSSTYRGGCRCDECRAAHLRRIAPYGHARRARIRGAIAENFDPREVFDRDGWVCGICDLPVDGSLAWPDPGAATLDHIVPISKGGAHVRANTQCAHFYCNNVKGDRPAEEVA